MLDHMPDHVLDHMIIGLVATALYLLYGSAAFSPATKTVTPYLLTTRSPDTFSRFSGEAIKPNSTHEYRASSWKPIMMTLSGYLRSHIDVPRSCVLPSLRVTILLLLSCASHHRNY